jgi:hypothetical protein
MKTPKQKAIELITLMSKETSLICVNEILKSMRKIKGYDEIKNYWKAVKKEINEM